MDIIKKLDKEITEQNRNGRNEIYIEKKDLRELGKESIGAGREFISKTELIKLMQNYEKRKFKQSLKIDNVTVDIKEHKEQEDERCL